MNVAVPSSRAPRALRGDTLRLALGDLGGGDEAPAPYDTQGTLRSALPVFPALPEPPPGDDEPAPAALRPYELARLLQGRG